MEKYRTKVNKVYNTAGRYITRSRRPERRPTARDLIGSITNIYYARMRNGFNGS